MRRGGTVGLVIMGLVFVGCGAAALTETGAVVVPLAPDQRAQAGLLPPRPMQQGLRSWGSLSSEPVAVPDGETARVEATPAQVAEASLVPVGQRAAPTTGPAAFSSAWCAIEAQVPVRVWNGWATAASPQSKKRGEPSRPVDAARII